MYTKVNLDPSLIEDVSVGNVLPPGGGASAARTSGARSGVFSVALGALGPE